MPDGRVEESNVMDSLVNAIVLRKMALTEGDYLLVFLSGALGRVQAVVRRASMAGPIDARFEPFTLGELSLYRRRGERIRRVHSFDILRSHAELRADLNLFCRASYLTELLDRSTVENAEAREEFALLLKAFVLMRSGGDVELVCRWFETRLLDIAGVGLDLTRCALCLTEGTERGSLSLQHGGLLCESCSPSEAPPLSPGSLTVLRRIQGTALPKLRGIRLREETMKELKDSLQTVIIQWLGTELKSVRFMETIIEPRLGQGVSL